MSYNFYESICPVKQFKCKKMTVEEKELSFMDLIDN